MAGPGREWHQVRPWPAALGAAVVIIARVVESIEENRAKTLLELTNTGNVKVEVAYHGHYERVDALVAPGTSCQIVFREGETLSLRAPQTEPGVAKRVFLDRSHASADRPPRVKADVTVLRITEYKNAADGKKLARLEPFSAEAAGQSTRQQLGEARELAILFSYRGW